jgi:hypothetical protein
VEVIRLVLEEVAHARHIHRWLKNFGSADLIDQAGIH